MDALEKAKYGKRAEIDKAKKEGFIFISEKRTFSCTAKTVCGYWRKRNMPGKSIWVT